MTLRSGKSVTEMDKLLIACESHDEEDSSAKTRGLSRVLVPASVWTNQSAPEITSSAKGPPSVAEVLCGWAWVRELNLPFLVSPPTEAWILLFQLAMSVRTTTTSMLLLSFTQFASQSKHPNLLSLCNYEIRNTVWSDDLLER